MKHSIISFGGFLFLSGCVPVTQAQTVKQAEVGSKGAEYGVELKKCLDGSTTYTAYEACAAKADIQFDRKDRNR